MHGDAGSPSPVLFLEFDGCVHRYGTYITQTGPVSRGPRGTVFFEYAPILHTVMARHPGVRIVLTTSWVEYFGYAWSKAQLPSSLLQSRVVGSIAESTTPQLRGITRGREIFEYAEHHAISHWVAVDVRDDGFSDKRECLVHCDETRGINDTKILAELEFKLSSLDETRSGDGTPAIPLSLFTT